MNDITTYIANARSNPQAFRRLFQHLINDMTDEELELFWNYCMQYGREAL